MYDKNMVAMILNDFFLHFYQETTRFSWSPREFLSKKAIAAHIYIYGQQWQIWTRNLVVPQDFLTVRESCGTTRFSCGLLVNKSPQDQKKILWWGWGLTNFIVFQLNVTF